MAVSLLSGQPGGPCPPPAPPSLPALFVRPQRRRRRRPPRVPRVGDRNQVKVAPSRSATVNRISGCRCPRGPVGDPPLAVPGSDRQVRKRRAQEPGCEGCTFPRSPLQASLGTRQRNAAISSHIQEGPRDNKSFAGAWAKAGGHRAGKRSTMGAEPPAGSACLSPAPRSSARLGSAPLGSSRLRSRSPRPAPPSPESGASRPRTALTPLGARRSSPGRTWAAGGSGRTAGVSGESRGPDLADCQFCVGGRLPGTMRQ